MPDYTKPNIKVPVGLWGEVKVAAYRRGMSAGELVVELLSEKYDDGYRKEHGLPSRASVKRLMDMVEKVAEPKPVSDGVCSKCGATGVKTAKNKEMKEVCYRCAGVEVI